MRACSLGLKGLDMVLGQNLDGAVGRKHHANSVGPDSLSI